MAATNTTYRYLGKPRKSVEGGEKVTGRARYAADVSLPGMLHLRPVLSPYAHAGIVAIDATAAEQIPGVQAVLTARDLPTKNTIMNSRSTAVLASDVAVFRGQPVVAVVAESESIAEEAAELVAIDYDEFSAIVDATAAAADDAPLVWPNGLPGQQEDAAGQHAAVGDDNSGEKQRCTGNVHQIHTFDRGDVTKGFEEADVVVERTYDTAIVHQGYMEPLAAVAQPDPVGGALTIYTATQAATYVRDQIAGLLSLKNSKVRVVPMTLGGGFGAKCNLIEPLVAAVAVALQRPVRLVLTRAEDFLTSTPSPGIVVHLKTGARQDGTVTAIEASAVIDNGVFPWSVGGLYSALLGGYYKFPNLKIRCREVLTHKPQVGAYRAPSAPQATFAIESNIDDMASQLGCDPLEFRLKNAVEAGDPMGNDAPWSSIGMRKCLEAMREHTASSNREKDPGEGIGIAVGGWPGGFSPAAAICRVASDGTIRIHVGSVDISGVNSSFVLVAAETLGVSPDQVEIITGDTTTNPHGPASSGSCVTYSVAGAVAEAAEAAKEKLLSIAADHLEARSEDLELHNGNVQVKGVPDRAVAIGELAAIGENKAGGPGPVIGNGCVAPAGNGPGFVVHLAKVRVDADTGHVTVTGYVAVQDVGFALNPLMINGQIHGGVAQGIGWGLHEAMIYDADGELLTTAFSDYDLPKARAVPDIETVIVQDPSPDGPFGVRGVGEPPIIPGAAAIANAIRDATGVRVTKLPIRPETLWREMRKNEA